MSHNVLTHSNKNQTDFSTMANKKRV